MVRRRRHALHFPPVRFSAHVCRLVSWVTLDHRQASVVDRRTLAKVPSVQHMSRRDGSGAAEPPSVGWRHGRRIPRGSRAQGRRARIDVMGAVPIDSISTTMRASASVVASRSLAMGHRCSCTRAPNRMPARRRRRCVNSSPTTTSTGLHRHPRVERRTQEWDELRTATAESAGETSRRHSRPAVRTARDLQARVSPRPGSSVRYRTPRTKRPGRAPVSTPCRRVTTPLTMVAS